MTLVLERVSPKIRRILETATLLTSLAIFIIVTYASVMYCVDIYRKGAISVLLALPLWPFYTAVPIGSLLLCFRLLFQLKSEIKDSRGNPDELIL